MIPSENQSVCHVFMSKLSNESRLEKEIGFLHTFGFRGTVTVLGVADPAVKVSDSLQEMADVQLLSPETSLRRVPIVGKLMRFRQWGRQVRKILRQRQDTLLVIHSLAALFVCCFMMRHHAQIIYDAHEYETERNGFAPWQKVVARIAERLCMNKVSEVWAVSPSIVEAYRRRYPRCPARLIMNMPMQPIQDDPSDSIRERLNLDADCVVFGYLGALAKGRNIECYLDTFRALWQDDAVPKATIPNLVILGEGPLSKLCIETAERFPNIHYLPPVGPNEVVAAAKSFDIGLCLIDPSSLSYKFSLPNKFFQHLSAGNLVLVLEDSQDMLSFAEQDNRILSTRLERFAQDVLETANSVSKKDSLQSLSEQTYYWESQNSTLEAAFLALSLGSSPLC